MTPWEVEAELRLAARSACGLSPEEIPFVWPRHDHAKPLADVASALPARVARTAVGRLPLSGTRPPSPPKQRVSGHIVDQLSQRGMEGHGVRFRRVDDDPRGFVNITFTDAQSAAVLAGAADGPRWLTGRAWDGEGQWPVSSLHEAGPVVQARRFARADARARIALAVADTPPPPGPDATEVSWRDPYLDDDCTELISPAGRALSAVGEGSARIAFCRSVPERPRDTATTGRELPVLPSAEYPGAWNRLTDANPAFRLRYAHAHAVSQLRWFADGARPLTACQGHTRPVRGLIFDGPGTLDTSARREEPHILVRYLEALASAYDEWRTCPRAAARSEGAVADPALPVAVAGVLRTGLFLLGVSAPTRL